MKIVSKNLSNIFIQLSSCLNDFGMSSIIPAFDILIICWFVLFLYWFSFNSSEEEIVVLLITDVVVTESRNNSVVVGKAETLTLKAKITKQQKQLLTFFI